MSVPNISSVVRQVRLSFPERFDSKDQLCAYAHAVVVALNQVDGNFGHLRKVEAQNHCVDPLGRIVGVDVALYKPSGQIIDFISSAGFGPDAPNNPTWNVGPEGEYTAADWIEPVDDGAEPGPGPVDPPPNTSDLKARVAVLEAKCRIYETQITSLYALHEEVSKQIGSHNEFLAKLDRRRFIGKVRVPYFGTLTVNCEPVD